MQKREEKIKSLIEKLDINRNEANLTMDKTETNDLENPILNKNDGYIEVRDHQLFVINPKKGGKYPVLLHNPDILIYVNGQLMKSKAIVSSMDDISVNMKSTPKPFNITISEDKISIFLLINQELYKVHKLKNQKRFNRFMPALEAVSFSFDVEEISTKIVEDIYKRDVKVDVDTTAIIQELINPTFKPVKVAEGLLPIPSVDSILENYFSTDIREVIEEVAGEVDFKNRLKIPSVKPGQVIAKLYPPKDGKEGFNVYGQTIHPKPPIKIEVRAKPRVQITDDGEVIALKYGRPTITGHSVKHIDILETYEINKDVDMKTGNIYFRGDIIVRGDIKDNMQVESLGNIYVFGNVYHAKLIAAQDIDIRGTVVNSKIIAGQLSVFYSDVYRKIQELSSSFKKMSDAMEQLKKSIEEKNLHFQFDETFLVLFNMKFKHVIDDVKALNKIFNGIPNNYIAVKFKVMINTLAKFNHFHTLHQVQSVDELISIQFSIKELITEMDSMIKEDSSIYLKSANSSTLKANGEIIIKNEGVVQSHLFAGTNITFERDDASIRGGKLEALKGIKASTVGSELGEVPELYAGEVLQTKRIYQANVKMPYYTRLFENHDDPIKLVYNPKSTSVSFQ